MNNPAMTIKGEQAKKQLIAAALAQFGEYGMNATTREIAAQAGQNIAAITYYFGSKEDLYLACAQWIADFIGEQFRPHAEEAERSAWWALLFLIPFIGWLIIIVFNCQAGTPGENRFGPDPKLEQD